MDEEDQLGENEERLILKCIRILVYLHLHRSHVFCTLPTILRVGVGQGNKILFSFPAQHLFPCMFVSSSSGPTLVSPYYE